MALFGTVHLVGLPHGPALPGAAALAAQLATSGFEIVPDAARADVVVVGPEAGPVTLAPGAGAVVLLDGAPTSAGARELLDRASIVPGGPVTGAHRVVPDSVMPPDLLAWAGSPELTVRATLDLGPGARPALRVAGPPGTPGPVVAALVEDDAEHGRLAVLGIDVLANAEPLARVVARHAIVWAARPAPAPARFTDRATELTQDPAWLALKAAVAELQPLQAKDGSVTSSHERAAELVDTVAQSVTSLAPRFPHDSAYLDALVKDLRRWSDEGLGVPDFYDSLVAFRPELDRVDGLRHLVVFPMYTQNGSPDRRLEAVLVEVIWPRFVAELEAGAYSNKLFVPIRFLDFTAGYDTNSAVLFPETVAMREVPAFTWGAIFADREAARFRKVVAAAAQTVRLPLPPDAERLLADQQLAEQTFVMWDLIHDRTHMRGDLPFDPFMIKQRMPYFLYALEELRCDLTAFRESVALEKQGVAHARLVQYAIIFDRVFRFAVTGSRVRNYDGLGGQLLFAWLHQRGVAHWTDNRLTIDWPQVPAAVMALGAQIEELYWRSIDRPKIAHWLAAYELVSATVTPHPASRWAQGPHALPLEGPLKEMTDAVLPDEFPLSMFHEALARKIGDVVASTAGITG